MNEQVHAMADQLRQYATHFEVRDWDYTRDVGGLRHIRYEGDWAGYFHPWRRLCRFLRHQLGPRDNLSRMLEYSPRRHPLIDAQVTLRTERHMPDGILDNGGIITFWEETGEYLQYVQPSVGALIADLMDAHPDLPAVQAIAAEMKRINDRYGERLATESVDDEQDAA